MRSPARQRNKASPRTRRALALILVYVAGAAGAEPPAGLRPLDVLIERAGLDSQLLHFEAAMQRGVGLLLEREGRVSHEVESRWRKAVANAYAPASLERVLRAELAKSLDERDIAAALAWIDSPTGRKLAALEEKAGAPEAQRRIEAATKQGIPPLGAERTRTLHELVRATRADEFAANVLIETAVGIQEGYAVYGAESSRQIVERMRRGMYSERGKVVTELHETSFVTFALVYAEASDAELAEALRFARSPAGARYHSLTTRAFESTIAFGAKRLGAALAAPAAPADI